jgi:hypothetical protein
MGLAFRRKGEFLQPVLNQKRFDLIEKILSPFWLYAPQYWEACIQRRSNAGRDRANSRLSFFQTLELPRIGAGSLDAFSCKFNLPSVPLKTGGIGWNISGNGFSLVGLI